MNQDSHSTPWYVIHTRPKRELMVASLLERHDEIIVFLPEVLQRVRGVKQRVPLFPRYLFVQLDLMNSPMGVLVHTPGVIGLVGSERQPLPVPDDVVSSLQERVAVVNDKGGLPPHSFQQGDAVLFRDGPMQGLEAVFVGPMDPAERVQVLLHFLGQEQEMAVDVGLLEKVNPVRKQPRPRRTRGKGRRVRRSEEQVADV